MNDQRWSKGLDYAIMLEGEIVARAASERHQEAIVCGLNYADGHVGRPPRDINEAINSELDRLETNLERNPHLRI